MNVQNRRTLLVSAGITLLASSAVFVGFLRSTAPIRAQFVPPPVGGGAGQEKAAANPVPGGPLPPPASEEVTITWDARFGRTPRKVSIVNGVQNMSLAYVEGDIIIGTLGDVRKAQRNELSRRAKRLKETGELYRGDVGLPRSAIKLIEEMANLPVDPTPLGEDNPARTEVVRLLGDIERLGVNQGSVSPTPSGDRMDAAPAAPAAVPAAPGAGSAPAARFPAELLRQLREELLRPVAGGGPASPDTFTPEAPRAMVPPADLRGNVPPEGAVVDSGQMLSIGLPANSPFLWPNGEVPFFIEQGYPDPAMIRRAMALWTAKTNRIRFREYRSGDQHWVQFRFQPGIAGGSSVGMVSPAGLGQLIMLPEPRTFPEPNIAHELGHAIGLFHEQSRPDRDHYLVFVQSHVISGYADQFQPPKQEFQIFGRFDFASIMLYDSWAFGAFGRSGGAETMLARWPQGHPYPPGSWGLNSPNIKGPSDGDIAVIETLYTQQAAPGADAAMQAPPAQRPDDSIFVPPPGLPQDQDQGPAQAPGGSGPVPMLSPPPGVLPPLGPPDASAVDKDDASTKNRNATDRSAAPGRTKDDRRRRSPF